MKDLLKYLYTGNGLITEVQWFTWIVTGIFLGYVLNLIF